MLIFELDQSISGINIWYKFNENPSKFVGMRALTKKCDGGTHGRTDARTHGRTPGISMSPLRVAAGDKNTIPDMTHEYILFITMLATL